MRTGDASPAPAKSREKHRFLTAGQTRSSPVRIRWPSHRAKFPAPNVLDFLDLATTNSGTQEMLIEEILVSRGSRFDRTTVGTSGIHREFGSMVLAVRHADGETRFNPTAQDPINGGDYLIVMGEPAQLSEPRMPLPSCKKTDRSGKSSLPAEMP